MQKILAVILVLTMAYGIKAQVVNTQFGTVQGTQVGTSFQFLGIPFAKPPIGNLRWKAPQNPNNWAGILLADSFAPACPQKHYEQGDTSYTIEGNEDCLYLNIWSPQLGTSAKKAVMVFIHGGGNQQGSANETAAGTQFYIGKNLAERGDVVVVTIQYRLGPLGFLAHAGLSAENADNTSGNYAVMDQVLALQWIKNNISAFGGDSNRVMIFGESAGGVNVGNLMLTPKATNLFHRACIQSGVPLIAPLNKALTEGSAFVDSFISIGTDAQKISYMRNLPADSLMRFAESPMLGGVASAKWRPVIDSVWFYNSAQNLYQSGNFNKVPFMIGSNADESSLSAPPIVTPGMVSALINSYVPSVYQAQATILYPPGSNNTDARKAYVGILTDGQFTANARRTAQCVSLNQDDSVYRYFFSYQHSVALLQPYGAYHGMELFYIFNNWENATLGSGPLFKPGDDSVQNLMLNYWCNFAKTGNPNGNNLPFWSAYQASVDNHMELKATPVHQNQGLRTAACNLWDSIINYTPCTSSLSISNSNQSPNFYVYPNPTRETIYIKGHSTALRICLRNGLGQVLYKGIQSEIPMKNLPAGLYILELNDQGKSGVFKVIKE